MRALILLTAASLAGCATLNDVPTSRVATAELRNSAGASAGTVQLTASAGDTLTLSVAALGMPAGTHGMHIHAAGTCEGPGFTSAGSHLNPASHQHGTLNPAGSHLGDLPNLVINSTGTGVSSAKLQGLRSEIEQALFDADGSAIVIHADADDYKTDPTGNSGVRIACGVLRRI